MNHHIALTTRRLPSFQSLLNPPQDSEDAGSTCANSEYESPNVHSCSNGVGKPTASTPSISEPRSTVQLSGPGQPMSTIPTTPVGSTPSPGGSSLAKSSQVKNCPFPAINDPRRTPGPEQSRQIPSRYCLPLPTPGPGPCQLALKFNVSSAEASYEHQVLENARLRLMGSQLAIDAARSSPVPKSTAATSHSQPSMASPEAHVHPPPTTTLSPQNAQWVQDSPTHHQGMQPYLGSPPSENAAPLCDEGVHVGGMRARYFGVDGVQCYMTLPGSEQVISVPVDLTRASKKTDEKRQKNAEASTKHRKKKKQEIEENFKELKELHEEKKEWEEKMKELYEEKKELEEKLKYFQGIIRQVPSLCHLVQEPNLAPQASNIAVGMDGLATRPQSRGGGSSPGERLSKRRRTDQALELSTPTYGAFMEPATSRRLVELPPRTSPENTSTRWFMPQGAGISTPSSMVASVW